ncbi:MAG: hypothetical protein JWN94_1478 [Betaproteobacteria bacterium]|jgi:hypothetical protein|nr:hypothetical protein [Betaproteobacteria bacterium]
MLRFDLKSVLTDNFLDRLTEEFRRVYGNSEEPFCDAIGTAGTMAMEILAESDALYHDAEHSMMVTLVGQEILRGKYLRDGRISARDWAHFIVSLLCHDIGYVRGICPGDAGNLAVVNAAGDTVKMPPAATDAYLTPYHVERGKLFVMWRFMDHPLIDARVIAANIENTRFPVPAATDPAIGSNWPGLVRAADLIGQLADPDYIRKLPALFHEFEETQANQRLGHKTHADLREQYPSFYWNFVSAHVQTSIEYLKVTRMGRKWLASLRSTMFAAQHWETM